MKSETRIVRALTFTPVVRKTDRWKPVSRGDIYCAPACGCGCTRSAFVFATIEANNLCQRLNRTTHLKGWKPRVWENCGWHYSALSACGRIKVHVHRHLTTDHFTAFLGDPESPGGTWAQSGKTPVLAVRKVIAEGKAAMARIGARIQGL